MEGTVKSGDRADNGPNSARRAGLGPAGVRSWMTRPVLRFMRHYAEMSVAMVAGMLVLGPVCHVAMTALGYPDPVNTVPWLAILLMAFTMSLPMVLWMLYRGHGWRRALEMAASMFVPAAVLIAFWGAGIMSGCQAHCTLHAVMWPSMLVIMLVRYEAYAGHDHGRLDAAES